MNTPCLPFRLKIIVLLFINSQTGQNGQTYNEKQDPVRVQLTFRSIDEIIEPFTMNIIPEQDGGLLRLRWDSGEYVIPFSVNK